MSLQSQATTIAGATVGTAGFTFPTWGQALEWVGPVWAAGIQLGGSAVILLTAVKLILEIRKLLRGGQ